MNRHIQAFAVVISVSDCFHWQYRNFWFGEPAVRIRPLHSLPSPSELAALFSWHTNNLVPREETPNRNLIQVSHQNELSWEWKQTARVVQALLQRLLLPVLGEQRLCGKAPCALASWGYSRWKGMAVSLCCASSACFKLSNVDANKGLLMKCFI